MLGPVRVLSEMPLAEMHHKCQECSSLQAADFGDGGICQPDAPDGAVVQGARRKV